jgi:hypothetical protein
VADPIPIARAIEAARARPFALFQDRNPWSADRIITELHLNAG